MSHFTVAVIHNEGESVEGILAPFQENNMEDCPKEYLEFDLEVPREEFKTRAKSLVDEIEKDMAKVLKDNKMDEYKRNQKMYLDYNEYYKNDAYEKIFEKYYGGEKNSNGDWGYYSNQSSRWDWYQVGGRWAGMLKLKRGKTGEVGEKSWGFKDEDPYKGGRVDSARIKDIDFAKMEEDYKEESEKTWRARRYQIAKSKKAGKTDKEINGEIAWSYGGTVKSTKKDWMVGRTKFGTYSILVNGEWIEKGSMGWFGCSSETEEEAKKWDNDYMEKLAEVSNPNQFITIVDCHV